MKLCLNNKYIHNSLHVFLATQSPDLLRENRDLS